MIIPLPYAKPPVTNNQRMHWRPKAKLVAEIRDTTWALAKQARTKQAVPEWPVEIGITWTVTDRRRRDPDGLSLTLKACIDGIVDAGLLPDDNSTYVSKTWQRIVVGTAVGMELTLESAA